MAKRFVDTELWQKEWFQDLTLKEKLLVKYIFENCDCAGVWNGNFKLASFIIGEQITVDDLNAINFKKHQFDLMDNGNIFVSDFIKFQYGTLSENCKPHKPIIEKLKKYGLLERVLKGYPKGIETLEEKEQEEVQEKEKESLKLYGSYSNVCLTTEQFGQFLAMCQSQKLADELIEALSGEIALGNSPKYREYEADKPEAHFETLKRFLRFRRRNPDKFRDEKKAQRPEFKTGYKPFKLSEEEIQESEEARKRCMEIFKKARIV